MLSTSGMNGYWTTRGFAISHTGQVADWTARRLVRSRTNNNNNNNNPICKAPECQKTSVALNSSWTGQLADAAANRK